MKTKTLLTEKQIHSQICNYLKLAYPKVLFNTDMSGIEPTKGQAMQASKLRSGRGFPDICIFEPSNNGSFMALFLEVKRSTPYLKNGKLSTNKHILEQKAVHDRLELRGYKVEFVWSFEQAKEIIEKYFDKYFNKHLKLS